jgi:hypothetical protein
MKILLSDASELALQAEDLRAQIGKRLIELSAALDEAHAAGFIVVFGLDFDHASGRWVPRPVGISKEF